ncbi:MAG: hypothetical protein EAZ91_01485 [Cytophagales bacterium]|nr:MAG: hypothetical protein EAZ91_01485 [Cytophagales bacterium]
MRKFYILLLATACFTASGFAVTSQTFTWEYYKVQLTVPDDFKVTQNTDEEFEMAGDGMTLLMELFEQNITIDELDEAVKTGAKTLKLEAVDDQHELDVNGLQGYYVEGIVKGNRVMFVGMMDPNSNTNFFISLVFDDEDKTAEADALRILSSVKKLK